MKHLVKKSPGGLNYFVDTKFSRVEHKMVNL